MNTQNQHANEIATSSNLGPPDRHNLQSHPVQRLEINCSRAPHQAFIPQQTQPTLGSQPEFLPELIQAAEVYYQRDDLCAAQEYARDKFLHLYHQAKRRENIFSECPGVFPIDGLASAINIFFFRGILTKPLGDGPPSARSRMLRGAYAGNISGRPVSANDREYYLGSIQGYTAWGTVLDPQVAPFATSDVVVNQHINRRDDQGNVWKERASVDSMVATLVHEMAHVYLGFWLRLYIQVCPDYKPEQKKMQNLGPHGHGVQFLRLLESMNDVIRGWDPMLAGFAPLERGDYDGPLDEGKQLAAQFRAKRLGKR